MTKHAGQMDKAGKAYFLHPMRVAVACATDEQRIVAMLHDVLEDTDVTVKDLLEEGFPQEIVEAVLSVTRHQGESYEDFIERCALNPIGRVVKLRDLEDNMNLLRLSKIETKDIDRLSRYINAHRRLTELSVSPNPCNDSPNPNTTEEVFETIEPFVPESSYRLVGATTDYNKTKPMVRMPDGSIIAENSGIDTLTKIIRFVGYDKVNSLQIFPKKNMPLLARRSQSRYYQEATCGWWILSNFPNEIKTQVINYIAKALHINMQASDVPK